MIESHDDENGADPSQVHWERMAEPQSDQYDSRVTLAFASAPVTGGGNLANARRFWTVGSHFARASNPSR